MLLIDGRVLIVCFCEFGVFNPGLLFNNALYIVKEICVVLIFGILLHK